MSQRRQELLLTACRPAWASRWRRLAAVIMRNSLWRAIRGQWCLSC